MSDDMMKGFQSWAKREIEALEAGAHDAADDLQAGMLENAQQVIGGMSGATFAAEVAYVAMPDNPNPGPAQAAYARAAGLLAGFDGHDGQPHLGSAPGPRAGEIMIVSTNPTDYNIALEYDSAGRKAYRADTLHQGAPALFQAVVNRLKGVR